jgi:hypothetical protein
MNETGIQGSTLRAQKLEAAVRHRITEEHLDLLSGNTPELLEAQGVALYQLLKVPPAGPALYLAEEDGCSARQDHVSDPLERDLRVAINMPAY